MTWLADEGIIPPLIVGHNRRFPAPVPVSTPLLGGRCRDVTSVGVLCNYDEMRLWFAALSILVYRAAGFRLGLGAVEWAGFGVARIGAGGGERAIADGADVDHDVRVTHLPARFEKQPAGNGAYVHAQSGQYSDYPARRTATRTPRTNRGVPAGSRGWLCPADGLQGPVARESLVAPSF